MVKQSRSLGKSAKSTFSGRLGSFSLSLAAAEVSVGNYRRRGIVIQGSNDGSGRARAREHDASESAAPEVDPIIPE